MSELTTGERRALAVIGAAALGGLLVMGWQRWTPSLTVREASRPVPVAQWDAALATLGRDDPCAKLCRAAVQELLALVKEYELCPKVSTSPRAKSGPRSRPKTDKKSSRS